MAFAQTFSCKCSLVVIKRKVWLICQPQAYRCSASPCPHAVLAVHLFLLFNRFKHEWSACRFWSLRQTSMFVFICATSRAKQRIVSSPLVPILRSCVRKCSHVKRISQKSVKHQYSIKCWTLTFLINHKETHALTCCTTVAAALDFLFTVFTIKIVLTGRTRIHCKGKKSASMKT